MEIFTACKQCGKLLFIPATFWETIQNVSSQNEKNLYIQVPPLKKNCDVTIHLDDESSEPSEKFLEEQSSMTFNSNLLYFPLCPDCSTNFLQHLRNYKKLYEKTTELIESKFSDIPKDVFNIQFQNAISPRGLKAQNNNNGMQNENEKKVNNFVGNVDLRRLSSIIEDNDICNDPFKCKNTVHGSLPILSDLQAVINKTRKFCPIMSCYAFKIAINRHYSTINDLRIGFFKYYPNSLFETNLALFFLLQLYNHMKRAFNIENIRIKLYPSPSISVNDSQFFKLKIPENKKHQRYDEINNAIHLLFVAFNVIHESSSNFPNFSMPPFEIDLENKTIGNIPYEFNWKRKEQWSNSMRLLLADLKMIQFKCLRSCFYH